MSGTQNWTAKLLVVDTIMASRMGRVQFKVRGYSGDTRSIMIKQHALNVMSRPTIQILMNMIHIAIYCNCVGNGTDSGGS